MNTTQPTLPMLGIVVPPSGPLKDRIAWILEKHPEARDDHQLVHVLYWQYYDGLERVLNPVGDSDIEDPLERFKWWYMNKARSPKTIQNRCMEVQRERPHLAASKSAQKKRRRQATQGAVN